MFRISMNIVLGHTLAWNKFCRNAVLKLDFCEKIEPFRHCFTAVHHTYCCSSSKNRSKSWIFHLIRKLNRATLKRKTIKFSFILSILRRSLTLRSSWMESMGKALQFKTSILLTCISPKGREVYEIFVFNQEGDKLNITLLCHQLLA